MAEYREARNGSRYIVMPMCPEECDAVAELECKCFSRPWTAKGFADALDQEGPIFLVAKGLDQSIYGYCGMYTSPGEGEITNVAVEPSMRGCGIASVLMTELQTEAVKQGVRTIFLEVRVTNASAISLYRSKGFEDCGIRKGFYSDPKEDALVMKCEL